MLNVLERISVPFVYFYCLFPQVKKLWHHKSVIGQLPWQSWSNTYFDVEDSDIRLCSTRIITFVSSLSSDRLISESINPFCSSWILLNNQKIWFAGPGQLEVPRVNTKHRETPFKPLFCPPLELLYLFCYTDFADFHYICLHFYQFICI